MKNIFLCNLIILLSIISFNANAQATEYKVFAVPQTNNSGKVLDLPEPDIFCVKEKDEDSYYTKYNYSTTTSSGYSYSYLASELRFKGQRLFYLSDTNCGVCRSHRIFDKEFNFDGKTYILKSTRTEDDLTQIDRETGVGPYDGSKTWLPFCLEPK